MIIIQAIDSQDRRWFRNARTGCWQQHRDADCHLMTPSAAQAAFRAATIADRFTSSADRMESIEMVEIS